MELAIDFGGTNIKLAVFREGSSDFLWSDRIPAYSKEGIGQALCRTKEYLTGHGFENFTVVGIAIPGIVNVDECKLITVNEKYMDAVGFDFSGWTWETYHCPLVMENDANAALLGEASYGCATGIRNAVMMIFGTGIGTAAILDGRIVRGPHYRAANLGGHSIIQINGERCNCGQRGCLEAYAGSESFVKRVNRELVTGQSALQKSQPITMKQIFEAAERGDSFANNQVKNLAEYYSVGILNMVYAYDPEIVVLSGGVMNGSKLLLNTLKEKVNSQEWVKNDPVKFVVAEKPDFSVTLGLKKRMEDLGKE